MTCYFSVAVLLQRNGVRSGTVESHGDEECHRDFIYIIKNAVQMHLLLIRLTAPGGGSRNEFLDKPLWPLSAVGLVNNAIGQTIAAV
jgi:hypothetical protein